MKESTDLRLVNVISTLSAVIWMMAYSSPAASGDTGLDKNGWHQGSSVADDIVPSPKTKGVLEKLQDCRQAWFEANNQAIAMEADFGGPGCQERKKSAEAISRKSLRTYDEIRAKYTPSTVPVTLLNQQLSACRQLLDFANFAITTCYQTGLSPSEPSPDAVPQPQSGCSIDPDCGINQYCDRGSCVRVSHGNSCRSDTDCFQGQSCSFHVCQ